MHALTCRYANSCKAMSELGITDAGCLGHARRKFHKFRAIAFAYLSLGQTEFMGSSGDIVVVQSGPSQYLESRNGPGSQTRGLDQSPLMASASDRVILT